VPLGYFNHLKLGYAFPGEIICKLLPQEAGMGSNNTVLAGVVSGDALEDPNPNLLFSCIFGCLSKGTLRDVKKEVPQPGRPTKRLARRNPLHKLPPGIAQQGVGASQIDGLGLF